MEVLQESSMAHFHFCSPHCTIQTPAKTRYHSLVGVAGGQPGISPRDLSPLTIFRYWSSTIKPPPPCRHHLFSPPLQAQSTFCHPLCHLNRPLSDLKTSPGSIDIGSRAERKMSSDEEFEDFAYEDDDVGFDEDAMEQGA